ncbi:DUF1839 family protein [Methylobacterium marchantiae]|uniref:DUF1839 family protein n=1 Tax=Methylobacterium marchantiae TaxID=600331 RepID=A0ABW3WRW0_9HYPH|nr:hypothetical protein AIGOOFII_3022 [Methylobacterium marchantiae]
MLAALVREETPEAPAPTSHPLHGSDRIWPETNCYVDLWIELLHGRGLVPEAMLGFTLRQDFEGDQFTFFKPFPGDLERLYGLSIQELAIFESLEAHALVQVARGCPVLVEVDAIHLPDTAGTTYGRDHGKTTIGILGLDVQARALDYLHNAGRFRLRGADYEGIFGPSTLFPYAEFVKEIGAPLPRRELHGVAFDMLRHHRRFAPRANPIFAFRRALEARAETLVQNPLGIFHSYAFNTTRQLGANFELLGSHLAWLDEQGGAGFAASAEAAQTLAAEAKAFQFQLARAFGRRNATGLCQRLDGLAGTYDRVFAALDSALA